MRCQATTRRPTLLYCVSSGDWVTPALLTTLERLADHCCRYSVRCGPVPA